MTSRKLLAENVTEMAKVNVSCIMQTEIVESLLAIANSQAGPEVDKRPSGDISRKNSFVVQRFRFRSTKWMRMLWRIIILTASLVQLRRR